MTTGQKQCRYEGHKRARSISKKKKSCYVQTQTNTKDKMTVCCLIVPILIVLQDFGSTAGGRWGEHGVLAWPKTQRRSLPRAGVRAKLGGELVRHGGAWWQNGSAVEQSWREIPAQKEEVIEYRFYGYHCQFIINTAAGKAVDMSWR